MSEVRRCRVNAIRASRRSCSERATTSSPWRRRPRCLLPCGRRRRDAAGRRDWSARDDHVDDGCAVDHDAGWSARSTASREEGVVLTSDARRRWSSSLIVSVPNIVRENVWSKAKTVKCIFKKHVITKRNSNMYCRSKVLSLKTTFNQYRFAVLYATIKAI